MLKKYGENAFLQAFNIQIFFEQNTLILFAGQTLLSRGLKIKVFEKAEGASRTAFIISVK